MFQLKSTIIALLLCSLFWLSVGLTQDMQSTQAHDWPQWRGKHRDGISAETGLLESWPAEGPQESWRKSLGDGFSSVSICQDKAYTMFDQGGKQYLVCLKAATGEEVWRTALDAAYENSWGNGPRTTPAIAGSLAITATAYAKLYAVETW